MRTFITKLTGLPFYLGSLLPMPVLFVLSDFSCFLLYHIFRYRRAIVRENITSSFPNKDPEMILAIEKEFYHHFCDMIFETMKSLSMSRKEIKRRFLVKNPGFLDQHYAKNQSIILYMAHYGNWEWIMFLPGFIRFRVLAFYQPLSNSYYDHLMRISRERCGVQVVESSRGYKTLKEYSSKGVLTLSCLIGDQSPAGASSMFWVDFLNRETAFLSGSDRIARLLHQAVVFLSMSKISRGRYELEFILLEDHPETSAKGEIIEKYARALEQQILKAPAFWLWSHRRWKLTPTVTS